MQKKINFCDSRYIRKSLKLELSLETFLTKVTIFTLLSLNLQINIMRVRKGTAMVANNPNDEKNSTKWSNQLNKVICGVKKFMKKETEEEKNPSSFSTSISKMNQKSKQGSESPTISKIATPEAKKTKRSEKIKKDTDKEKKLPKKYRKGW